MKTSAEESQSQRGVCTWPRWPALVHTREHGLMMDSRTGLPVVGKGRNVGKVGEMQGKQKPQVSPGCQARTLEDSANALETELRALRGFGIAELKSGGGLTAPHTYAEGALRKGFSPVPLLVRYLNPGGTPCTFRKCRWSE